MTQEADDLLKRALALPSADRADIASVLINSLDPEEDAAVRAAWDAEIARRIEDLDSGKVQTISWEDVCRRIAAAVAKK